MSRFKIEGADTMPQIIPIRDLKKTSELSEMCRTAREHVFITKNGYGDMVNSYIGQVPCIKNHDTADPFHCVICL